MTNKIDKANLTGACGAAIIPPPKETFRQRLPSLLVVGAIFLVFMGGLSYVLRLDQFSGGFGRCMKDTNSDNWFFPSDSRHCNKEKLHDAGH